MSNSTGWRVRLAGAAVLAALVAVIGAPSAQAAPAAAARAPMPRSLDAVAIQQVAMINRFRSARGLPLLRLDGHLTRSANWMARDMATQNYFAHQDSRRRGFYRRLDQFQYPVRSTWTGENLAAGHADAETTYQQWLNSTPHRRNWLNPRFRAIGIARVYVEGSKYGWYWVTDFGSHRVAPLCMKVIGLRTCR